MARRMTKPLRRTTKTPKRPTRRPTSAKKPRRPTAAKRPTRPSTASSKTEAILYLAPADRRPSAGAVNEQSHARADVFAKYMLKGKQVIKRLAHDRNGRAYWAPCAHESRAALQRAYNKVTEKRIQ